MTEAVAWTRRNRWPVLVGLGLLFMVVYQAIWLLRMRDGYPVDIDEAGYLAIAFNNLDAFKTDGLNGLWNAYSQQAPNAPLVTLLTLPFLEFREGILPAFGVQWLALLSLGAATYALARSLVTPPWAALATLIVVAMPGVINYTREFSFALPCAAAFTASLLAIVKSRYMGSLPLALAFGVAAGLAALSRTMALGLLPGLVLAAVLWAGLAPRELRLRAFLNLSAGLAAGLAVAATWYVRNLGGVLDYLTGFGYGDQAGGFGEKHPLLSMDRWTQALHTISWQELFVPLLGVSLAIVLVGAFFGFRRLAKPDRRAWRNRLVRSPASAMLAFIVPGYLALSSTANAGTAFALPLLPTALVLLVALAARFPLRWLRVTAATSLVLVTLLQLLSFAQIGGPTERIRAVSVPLLGDVPITNPRAPVVGATASPNGELRFTDADSEWLEAGASLAYLVNSKAQSEGRNPVLGVANRDIVLNTNFLDFSARLSNQPRFPVAQLEPGYEGDTVQAYVKELTDPAFGQPNVLITSGDEARDFPPLITQARAVKAAKRAGFRPYATYVQPNGEKLTLWWIDRGPAVPGAALSPSPDSGGKAGSG